jgi:hypothetical protein
VPLGHKFAEADYSVCGSRDATIRKAKSLQVSVHPKKAFDLRTHVPKARDLDRCLEPVIVGLQIKDRFRDRKIWGQMHRRNPLILVIHEAAESYVVFLL